MKERKMIEVPIDYPLSWQYEKSIVELRADLDAIENLGATHLNINGHTYHGVDYVECAAIQHRPETEEEALKIVDGEEKQKTAIEKIELMQLEKLKAKYEK